jgi:hypothetical protein
MTPFAERIFLAEIVKQIEGARRALRRLAANLWLRA